MTARFASLAVVIVSLASYHITQRSMPGSVRPAPLFAFVYGTATIVLLAVVTVGRSTGNVGDVASVATHAAPWILAASVAGIELGFFAMYRAGWTISTGAVTAQAVVAGVLAIVGVAHFGEHVTPTRAAGLLLCVVGAGLVAR